MRQLHIGINAHILSFKAGYRRAGVSQYTEQILRRLAIDAPARGDVVTVFAGPDDPPVRFVPSGIDWRQSRLPTGHAPGRIVWEQAVAPFAGARAGLDVLFCPLNVVPLVGRIPSVVTVHDLAFLAHPEAFHPSRRRYLTAMTRLSVRKARHVIAVSEHTKADLVHHFGIAADRITVIPNAADSRFRPEADQRIIDEFRHAHDLPERFVLFVGTLEPRKNLRRLIEAVARIATDDPQLKLVIIGATGWLTSDIAPLVTRLKLADRVIFMGYVDDDDLPRFYQAATVFCYPSLYEGFGLPVLEAMACGTPVVTSNTSSLPELAGDAALLVNPTDVDAIADGLRLLLSDTTRREVLVTAGLQRASTYSWNRTAEATLTVIERAAGQ